MLTVSGPLLVLAGAGTGKTRVITYRMAELIRRGTPPERILSVTFTNKAAREMQQRTAALLGRRGPQRPLVATFHSLCVRILRQEAPALGYPPKFTIYDRGDQESAARSALRDIRVTDKALSPGDLVNRISRWKSQGIRPEGASDRIENDQDFLSAMAYRRYQLGLKSRGAVDFDDLLLLTHRLFREFPEVLSRHQPASTHVQIDEYQDTNGIQFALVEALVPAASIFVRRRRRRPVDLRLARGRSSPHPRVRANFSGGKVVRLEENYRSNPAVLELANRLVAHNPGRHVKQLKACRPVNGEVRFLGFEDEQTEATSVVEEIAALIEGGIAPGDVAILFRTNEQPRLFEGNSAAGDCPTSSSAANRFTIAAKSAICWLISKWSRGPTDESALLRIINTPPRGIGDATIDKLTTRAVKAGKSLWQVVPEAQAAGEIPARALAGLEELQNLLARLRRQFRRGPIASFRSCSITCWKASITNPRSNACMTNRNNSSPGMGALEQLRESIKTYADRAESPSLAGFLDDSALLGRDEEPDAEETAAANAVKLDDAAQRQGARVSPRLSRRARRGTVAAPAVARGRRKHDRRRAAACLRRRDAGHDRPDDHLGRLPHEMGQAAAVARLPLRPRNAAAQRRKRRRREE